MVICQIWFAKSMFVSRYNIKWSRLNKYTKSGICKVLFDAFDLIIVVNFLVKLFVNKKFFKLKSYAVIMVICYSWFANSALVFCYNTKVKLATLVKGDPKAPFSIATTPRCWRGWYFFPGLLLFTLDPQLLVRSAKQGGIKYHFLNLKYGSTWDWILVSRTTGEHSTH